MNVFLVAEIGQNHQGSVEVAKDLVRMCAAPKRHDLYGPDVGGVDAVKLTRRALDHEATPEFMDRPYPGEHSFGATYREHRAALELSDEEHAEVWRYAKSLGLDFVETLCHPKCLSALSHLTPDALKVASRDLTNLPLLNALAETGIPLILSTGMASSWDLDRALDIVARYHDDITILHCLSQYPADYGNLNLHRIRALNETYPYPVGYSDHSVGIMAPVAAAALGASVIEKHVTLDRTMRGSDHAGALDRDGVYRWVRDIRHFEQAMGRPTWHRPAAAKAAAKKLERSVAAARDIEPGHVITERDIHPLSPGDGLRWPERYVVLGQRARAYIPKDALIAESDIEAARQVA